MLMELDERETSRLSKNDFNYLQMYCTIIYYQWAYSQSLSSSTSSSLDYKQFITL